MKSLRSTLIFLVIVAALGAYIWFNERGPVAESGAVVLLRTDPKQVNEIALTQDSQTITLTRDGENWKVKDSQKTFAVPADGNAVKSVLSDLQLVQAPSALPDSAENLKEYGLSKPRQVLQVGDTKFEFGDSPQFDSSKIYARVTTSGKTQVALVPNALSVSVAKKLDDWRDKAALRVTLDEAQKIALKAPDITATFEKTKSGEDGSPSEWKISAPVTAEAEGSTVESLIGQLPITQVTKFLDDNPKSPATWGLDKPQAQIEVTTPGGPRSLLIGKKLSTGYAAKNSVSPTVFELPLSFFSLINRPLRDWRRKSVLKFELEKLSSVIITARGGSKTFSQVKEKWRENGREPGSVAKEQEAADNSHRAVLDVLLAAQDLKANDFIDKAGAPADYGLDKPLLDLKMDSQRLQIGEKGGQVYARTGSGDNFSGPIFVLPGSSRESLSPPLDTLFAKPKK